MDSASNDVRDTQQRVAVIAVHGVGDPSVGHPASQLSDLLLCDSAAGAERDAPSQFKQVDISIPVDLAWRLPQQSEVEHNADIEQSREALAGMRDDTSLGPYRTVRRDGRIQGQAGNSLSVHVYELNWADLSRAPGQLAAVILNLYQLAFHLAVLGRRSVMLARQADPLSVVRAADWMHRIAEGLLPTSIPVLNLYLLAASLPLIALFIPEGTDDVVGAGVAAMVVLVGLAYRGVSQVWYGPATAVALPLGCAVAMITLVGTQTRLAIVGWIVTSVAMYLAWRGSCALVRSHSRLRWLPYLGGVLVIASGGYGLFHVLALDETTLFQTLLLVSTYIVHSLFLLLQLLWALLLLVMLGAWLAWLVARLRLGSATARCARALYSGALGLMLSSTVFFMLTIVLWSAILSEVIDKLEVLPLFFDPPFGLLYPALTDVSQSMPLHAYVEGLFRLTTGDGVNGFLLTLVLCAMIALAAMLPSASYESRPSDRARDRDSVRARYLGVWLDKGFKALSLAALALWLGFVWLAFGYDPSLSDLKLLPDFLVGRDLIVKLGASLAGAIPLILLFRRQLPAAARNALDILLDVNNWLTRAPDRSTPRGRILARYLSLLRSIHSSGDYDRIVIVAHSQGTVITADALRLLKALPQLARQVFGASSAPDIRLITAGSPLRQLYARRFPHEYGWVEEQPVAGPNLESLYGVSRWINFYHSWDYVGRALWDPPPDTLRNMSALGGSGAAKQLDILLGAGAHTHYFDGADPLPGAIIRSQLPKV